MKQTVIRPDMPPVPVLPPRARLATWQERQKSLLTKIPESVRTAWNTLYEDARGQDHQLGRLDDASQTLGIAAIAGLGSLGARQSGVAIPMWLGAASWLGAMAITPWLIHRAVFLKTGVNLGIQYMSSRGEVHRLFQDPNYMPLQVIPLEKRIQLAQRLGISRNHPDRPALLQKKLKQIAVQAHTWWMLVAGMATPVISAVLCDTLEEPIKAVLGRLRVWQAFRFQLIPALGHHHGPATDKAVQAVIQATLGTGNDMTVLSRWWKQLSGQVIRAVGMDKLPQSVLLHNLPEQRYQAIIRHLAERLQCLEVRDRFCTVLTQQQNQLKDLFKPLEQMLSHPQIKALSGFPRWMQQVSLQQASAQATLSHLRGLLDVPLENLAKGKAMVALKQRMENALLPVVIQHYQQGALQRAMEAAGGSERFSEIMVSFRNGGYGPSFRHMGASPKEFLEFTLRSLGMRRRWLRRFPGWIGGGVALATLLYVVFVLGEDLNGTHPAGRRG